MREVATPVRDIVGETLLCTMQLRLDRIDLEKNLLSAGATGQLVHHLPYDLRGILIAKLSVDLDDFMIWFLELFHF